MKREDLTWIIPLLEKLRDNPDAQLMYENVPLWLESVEWSQPANTYSVHIPRKYRLYKRTEHHDNVYCVTNYEARIKEIKKDPSVTWLTDWLPVPTGP